jgi:biotin transport system substrate-specific component
MTALAQAIPRPADRAPRALVDAGLVVLGSFVIAGLSLWEVHLAYTPVPITGQTLGVLLVGASLGSWRGGSAALLYLVWGIVGLPVYAGGEAGLGYLGLASPSGGYLWGFVIAAVLVGLLAERGWDRSIGSAIGAMLLGSLVIYLFGVPWLMAAVGFGFGDALEAGVYPFVVGDVVKLLAAAGALPLAWRLLGRR